MKYFILIILYLLFYNNISQADTYDKIRSTINTVNQFGQMEFGPKGPKGKMSKEKFNQAAKLLEKALYHAKSVSNKDLRNKLGSRFSSEWNKFTLALSLRLDGWRNIDIKKSTEGIRGMENFRKYYQSLKKKSKKSDSWFSWDISKGEILPSIGCNKGAVVSWLLGC